MPSELPTPPVPNESRRVAPLDAHEASYLAASARIASFSIVFTRHRYQHAVSRCATGVRVLFMHLKRVGAVRVAYANSLVAPSHRKHRMKPGFIGASLA